VLSPRKLTAAIAIAAVPLATLVAVGASTGTAGATAPAQAGTIKCTKATGTATANPPITTAGTKTVTKETLSFSATVTSCKASAGANPTKGVASTKFVVNAAGGYANSCTSLLKVTGKPVMTIAWNRATPLANSVVTFPNFTILNLLSGDIGFKLPGTGKATGTGSYMGTNKGASSTVTFYLNNTATAFLAACGTKAGISSFKIVSGSGTVG
jgi:hypothetical protein